MIICPMIHMESFTRYANKVIFTIENERCQFLCEYPLENISLLARAVWLFIDSCLTEHTLQVVTQGSKFFVR